MDVVLRVAPRAEIEQTRLVAILRRTEPTLACETVGARCIASRHTDVSLVSPLARRGVPCMPGALGPTEILAEPQLIAERRLDELAERATAFLRIAARSQRTT